MLKELKKKRRRLQSLTLVGLPLVLTGGWFYPPLGFLLFGCMVGAVALALYRGSRAWCDWMCPRGSFYDLALGKISPKRQIPAFLKTRFFRGGMLGIIFLVLGGQLFLARGDFNQMGLALTRVLTVTTSAGILLAAVYHPRAWCHICPMGTLGNWLSKGKEALTIGENCTGCKACAKACPMQLKPYSFAGEGAILDRDCVKCLTCVASCPKKAIRPANQAGKAIVGDAA